MKKTRSEAHCLWKFLEKIYEDESENEDQEEEEKSLEEYTTATANTCPLVTPHEDQGARTEMSAGPYWNWSDRSTRPVRPVLPGDIAKKARNAPVGDQDKFQLDQHPQVMLITNA